MIRFAGLLTIEHLSPVKIVSPESAVQHINSFDGIFVHSAAAVPLSLIYALSFRHKELKGVRIYSIHTEGEAPYAKLDYEDSFIPYPFFVGSNIRQALDANMGSYIPTFLSEVPALFRNGSIPIDVALISVSPPDKHGYCSLGPSVDISLAAIESAKTVFAEINTFMPRSHGDGFIPIKRIDFAVERNAQLPSINPPFLSEEELTVGRNVAELIENGATLQLGIGAIPNATMQFLLNHKDLGIHSEMFTDSILPLVENGAINGAKKKIHPHTIVGSFALGSEKLYAYIDDNPSVRMLDFSYVNNPRNICRNSKVTAINSAIEIDLSGQVCADSIGKKIYSGVGGQMDFITGASYSEGGKAIIAMTSTTKNGASKIVPLLKNGAGVVTTRAHVHWIVTEHGAADLYGKSLKERKRLLIQIAHPKHREWLERNSID